jgi:hypothetical protein
MIVRPEDIDGLDFVKYICIMGHFERSLWD